MPAPNSGETESQFIGRCVPIVMHENPNMKQDQAVAICYKYWRGESMHPDFERILSLFLKRYAKEGTKKFVNFIKRNNLNILKAYNPKTQFRESFEWIEPLIQPYKKDKQAKYYLVRALTANISMNNNDYGPYPRLEDAAKTLSWRPVNIDHDHNQWLPYPRTRTDFSNANEFSVEATLRVDNQDAWLQKMLDKGEIVHPSIEGRPDPMGGYHFTGMALLRKGYELPGDPLTEILPLVFNESVGKSLCEFKDGKLVCQSKKDSEVKILKESMIREAIKEVLKEQADEQKCPEGKHWDDELKKCVPDKMTEQEGNEPILPTPDESPPEKDTQPPLPHECETGFHWDDAKQQCVPDEVGDSAATPMVSLTPSGGGPAPVTMAEQEVPAATNAPSTVAGEDTATCPEGQHWDPDANKCVDDVKEECEAGWHWNPALQKCVPDEAAVNESKLRLKAADWELENINLGEAVTELKEENQALKTQMKRKDADNTKRIEKLIQANYTKDGIISEANKRIDSLEAKDRRNCSQITELAKREQMALKEREDAIASRDSYKTMHVSERKSREETLTENQKLSKENLDLTNELTEAKAREIQYKKKEVKFQEDLAKAMKHQKYLYEFLKKHNFELVET